MTQHRPARKAYYYPSMAAYAAVQAVMAPLLEVEEAPFSGREGAGRECVRVVRDLWQRRARELSAAGYPPLKRRHELGHALACPHKLLAHDGREAGHGCHHDAVCPFCWAERTALAFVNARRARERNPGCLFLLARLADLAEVRARPGVVGTWPGSTPDRVLVAVDSGSRRALPDDVEDWKAWPWGSWTEWPVPDDSLGLARAVAWLRPYPVEALLGPADDLLGGYERGGGRHRPRPDGVFRHRANARHLSGCEERLIAPAVKGDPLADGLFHRAERLASSLPETWDHRGFILRHLGRRLEGPLSRLAWVGELPWGPKTVVSLFSAPSRAWGPHLAALKRHEGALCRMPGQGYFVLRPHSDEDLTARRFPFDGEFWEDLHPSRGPDGTCINFGLRKRIYSFEPLAIWAWLQENPREEGRRDGHARAA
jgi:hypothetical protein